jgi:hypothetical protein
LFGLGGLNEVKEMPMLVEEACGLLSCGLAERSCGLLGGLVVLLGSFAGGFRISKSSFFGDRRASYIPRGRKCMFIKTTTTVECYQFFE